MTKQGGIKDIAVGRSDVYRISPLDIHIRNGWNGRDFSLPENIEHVEMLSRSIAEIGVKKPVTVIWEDGKAWLTDGECRLRATLLAIEAGAEIKSIPAMTEDRHSSEADRLFTQIVGNSGKTFNSLEKAAVFKRLIALGWTEKDIADKSGISRQHVTNLLDLSAAPKEIADMVTAGEVSPTTAVKVMRKDKKKATETLTKAVATAKKSGKKKASARHIGKSSTGKTFKAELKEIFGRATILPNMFMFKPEDHARLIELFPAKK